MQLVIARKNTQKEDVKYCWTFGYNERAKTQNIHYLLMISLIIYF